VAWSLEIEIQFYLLMPVFLYLLNLFGKKYWRYFIYVVLFTFFINVNLFQGMDLSDYMYAFIPGIVAADFYKTKLLKRHYIWDIVFVIALVLFFFINDSLFIKSILLLLIISSSLNLTILRSAINSNLVVIIGGMCYSLYLLHYPLYFLLSKLFSERFTVFEVYELDYLLQALIFIPLSIVLISIYYILVEKPFMVLSKNVKGGISFSQYIASIGLIKK
jgi:peptidoglycan/LPS O-acetylase OafA/YrhL